ncbi:MAG: hypothetical protein WD078_16410 [Woeseia sp.]
MQVKITSHAAIILLASLAGVHGLATTIPAAHAKATPPVPSTNSAASFINWRQGFEHGTDGWYDASTEGLLGWCGSIEQVTPDNRGRADLRPSAGRSFATVEFGGCNEFWTGLFGSALAGAPYGPGPELALYSDSWPRAGYVTELDIYLDPAWSEAYSGNFGFTGQSTEAIIQYAATIFPQDHTPGDPHVGPHYFVDVDAAAMNGTLIVAGHEITAAGWYTFRFLFSDEGGNVRVDFELRGTRGGTLARLDSVAPTELGGPFKFPYGDEVPTSGYGSGHVWFFDIASGLKLPIDEHRVRRGR